MLGSFMLHLSSEQVATYLMTIYLQRSAARNTMFPCFNALKITDGAYHLLSIQCIASQICIGPSFMRSFGMPLRWYYSFRVRQ